VIIRNDNPWLETDVIQPPLNALGNLASPASRFATQVRTGQSISFRLGDVYAPSLTDLFKQITPGLELQGRIVLLSDGGETQSAFAIVEVPGVLVPLIVPTSCLELVNE